MAANNLFQLFPGLQLGPQGPGAMQIATDDGLGWANKVTGADGRTYILQPNAQSGGVDMYPADWKPGEARMEFGQDGTLKNGYAMQNDNWKQMLAQWAATAASMYFGIPAAQGADSASLATGVAGDTTAAGYGGLDAASTATMGGGATLGGGEAAAGTGAMGAGAAEAGGVAGGIAPTTALTATDVGAGAGSLVPEATAGVGAAGAAAAGAGAAGGGAAAGTGLGSLSASDMGAAALKYGAPVLGGLISANAAKSAADSTGAATDRANALLKLNYDTTRNDLAPWRASGSAAAGALSQKLGIGGDPNAGDYGSLTKQFTGADLPNDPGYQFGLNQGQKQLDQKAAAGGSYYSGAALKAATQYGQDYAGTKFGEAFNRDQATKQQTYGMLSGTSGLGENAAAMTGNFGAQTTGAMSNNTTAQGTAMGASQIAQGNALNNGLTNLYQNYNTGVQQDQQNALIKAIMGGNARGF